LKGILALWLPIIGKRFRTNRAIEAQLLWISPRTIDRAVKGKKRELPVVSSPGPGREHCSATRSSSSANTGIIQDPGHLELATVSRCVGNGEGLFAYSFYPANIASTLDETRSVLGRGEHGTVQAFSGMCEVLPFKVWDIDSDNGSEFINREL
jgi:hypothetical protein